MFNRTKKLEAAVFGPHRWVSDFGHRLYVGRDEVKGLEWRLKQAEIEIAKLKAIVAELVDFVYAEKDAPTAFGPDVSGDVEGVWP